eukprot:CAMPEP_0117798644 /NCGR_PEP_ID=MMETSP0948-20121206/13281_1 /TAXON_ID=44440 /ORGANISM="Chattonella subsalsa, Strain CCMP2191" /LENGTH=353 /DNA_ID=CAMNT_0005630339 /DNA_START=1 /DNA_END=1066 /DNA_ORIENTATION=-
MEKVVSPVVASIRFRRRRSQRKVFASEQENKNACPEIKREYVPIVMSARGSSPEKSPVLHHQHRGRCYTAPEPDQLQQKLPQRKLHRMRAITDESISKWPGLVVESKGQTSARLNPIKIGPNGTRTPLVAKSHSDSIVDFTVGTHDSKPSSPSKNCPVNNVDLSGGKDKEQDLLMVIPKKGISRTGSGLGSPGKGSAMSGRRSPGSPGSLSSPGRKHVPQIVYKSNYVSGLPLFKIKVRIDKNTYKVPYYDDDTPLSKAYLIVVKLGLQGNSNYLTYLNGLKDEIECQLEEYLQHKREKNIIARQVPKERVKHPYVDICESRIRQRHDSGKEFGGSALALGAPQYTIKKGHIP